MQSAFGAVVERLRKARSQSLQDLGLQLGVSRQTVWDWEKGRSHPPMPDVPRIAGILGTTICELYGVEEGHTRQHDREKRVREVRDAAVARLMAGHEQAPKAEQDFIREIAEAADRFRQRLVSEEGLDGPVPASPAALTD